MSLEIRMNSGTNLEDLAERVNSGTNLGDLVGDLVERVNSDTNLGDLAERVNSGINLGDLIERMNSGTNLGDLVERVNLGTNLGDLAERVNSGTNLGDLAERVNSGTNLRDLAEGVNSGTNLGDLAEWVEMTSSDSSSNVGVVPFPGSGGTSPDEPEASSSGTSSGPSSPVDAKILRDLNIMKAGHDLDTTVTEGSLVAIRERYSIPREYGLHVPQPGQRPYSSDVPGVCISVDALEAGLRFPLHSTIEECLRWWGISPSQVAPNSWRYLVVFLGECQGAGIIPTRNLFMACFRLCKSRSGYYLTARVGFKVSGAPSNNKGWKARYLFVSGPSWGFRLDWSACPISNVPPYLSEEESILVDRLKGILSSSRAIKEMTELWLVEADLSPASREPTASVEELETPVESTEEIVMPVFHLPKSMKDLCGTKIRKDDAGYYALYMSNLAHQDSDKEMQARWEKLKNSTKIWNDLMAAEEFERGLLHPQLARELYTLSSEVLLARATNEMVLITSLQQEIDALKLGGGPEAVAAAKERATKLEKELEKTKREQDEVLQRLEISDKELNEARGDLSEAQRQLKEARVRARRADDELLKSMKELESVRVELPRQVTNDYKGSASFKEGLKRMGRVSYEYGYRVALARFRALHPDSEVEEDPFTIHPEDDSVPMERQQAFDDSDPPEP
ncbi:hypothetical protein B296_00011508 [Ensete ventricosum]|uniref:Transposase (putative) gypsy type domain-containing protein n=1 Tax=Ensete ventricosum TaxID=4639 RepID=A0A427B844_ENSVE|nr:hypothetical protein B296_00011508 [Ensete ventricosum]